MGGSVADEPAPASGGNEPDGGGSSGTAVGGSTFSSSIPGCPGLPVEPTSDVPDCLGEAECSHSPNGGWYFDSVIDPQQIRVCPCSCLTLQSGTVEIQFGCTPRVWDTE